MGTNLSFTVKFAVKCVQSYSGTGMTGVDLNFRAEQFSLSETVRVLFNWRIWSRS